jgi:hypothetical protein
MCVTVGRIRSGPDRYAPQWNPTVARATCIVPVSWLAWDAMPSAALGLREGVFLATGELVFVMPAAIPRVSALSDHLRWQNPR